MTNKETMIITMLEREAEKAKLSNNAKYRQGKLSAINWLEQNLGSMLDYDWTLCEEELPRQGDAVICLCECMLALRQEVFIYWAEIEPPKNRKGENKMKKVFISVPMRGREKEEIEKNIAKMHKIAEAVFEQELEVINTTVKGIPPTGKTAVWCLGESIKKMADADYFIGVHFAFEHFGCLTENEVAQRYFDIENIYYIPIETIIPGYLSEENE